MRPVWAEPYNVHIFIAAADGSGRKDITQGDGTDWNNPSWSPDGQRMAASAGTYSQVENMDLTGNDRIQVTNIGTNRNPSWLSNSEIVYEGVRQGPGFYAPYLIKNGAGGGFETYLSGKDATAPAVSPDNTKIAFVQITANGQQYISIMQSDGSNETIQSATLGGFSPTWCSDNSCISYIVHNEGGDKIYTLSLAAQASPVLIKTFAAGDKIDHISQYGDKFAYSFQPGGKQLGEDTEVQVLEAGVITHIGTGWMPDWNPDGTKLVFVDNPIGVVPTFQPTPWQAPTSTPATGATTTPLATPKPVYLPTIRR